MVPEKLSIGLPSNEATAQRCGRGRRVAPRQLHLPKQAFRAARIVPERGHRPGAAERRARGNSNEAQLAGHLPGVLERPAEAVDLVAARPAAVVAVVLVNAVLQAKPSFVTAHDLQRDRVSEPTLLAPRPSARRGGRTTEVRNRLLSGLLPSSMTASARWQLGSARATYSVSSPTASSLPPPDVAIDLSGGPHPWPRRRSARFRLLARAPLSLPPPALEVAGARPGQPRRSLPPGAAPPSCGSRRAAPDARSRRLRSQRAAPAFVPPPVRARPRSLPRAAGCAPPPPPASGRGSSPPPRLSGRRWRLPRRSRCRGRQPPRPSRWR